MPFERFRVDCEGETHFCCYQRIHSLGSLVRSSFEEIWFGERAEEVRRETLKGRFHDFCLVEGCPALYRATRAVSPRKTGHPKILEIDLPDDHCNVGGKNPGVDSPACIMCERNNPKYALKRSQAIYDVLPGLKVLVPHLTAIHIQGIAEAFWHDAIFRVLDLLEFDRHRERIFVSTFTNGIALGPERRKRFLERCPNSTVTFSLDASTPGTYEKIRQLDVYPLVLKNLIGYARDRKAHPNAALRIHNNINTLNVDEVIGMVRVAAEAEVDALLFSPTLGFETSILVNPGNAHRFGDAQLAIEEEGRKLGLKLEFLKPLDNGILAGKKPVPRPVTGHLDSAGSGRVLGWAWDPKEPGRKLEIEILADGGSFACTVVADRYRKDLEDAGIGDGRYAFEFTLPPGLLSSACSISARVRTPSTELIGSPKTMPTA